MTLLSLTINDKNVEVETGSTILEAAQKAGANIPTLCHHPQLHPYGSCRLCLVEVEGARTLMPACTVPATQNMVVRTDTEKTKKARNFVLSMLFSERNHFCMYCVKTDGDCELQQAAYAEDMNFWPITPAYDPFLVDASHEHIMMDTNRCILCRRCVRTCGELVGNFTLGFEERGSLSQLIADHGVPWGESSCISCGNCVQHCPTASIYDRYSAYKGRKTDLTHTKAVCMECSMGCDRVLLTRDNQLVRIDGDESSTFNEGLLCQLGRYRPLEDKRERLLYPMVRKQGVLTETSWEEALQVAADKIDQTQCSGIRAAISPRFSIEAMADFAAYFKGYLQVPEVEVLQTDQSSEMSRKLAAKMGAFEGDLEQLKDLDLAVVIGADLVELQQVAGFFIKRQMPNGLRFFFAGPDVGNLDRFATDKIIYTGRDYLSVIKMLVKDQGEERGWLAAKLGLDPAELERFVQKSNESSKVAYILGSDLMTDYNYSLLEELMGFIEEQPGSVIVLKGRVGGYAASLLNLEPVDLYSSISGLGFFALGDAYLDDATRQVIDRSEFKIFCTSVIDEQRMKGDVLLPIPNWAELEAHYLTSDGKVKRAGKALEAPGNTRPLVDILEDLGQRTGFTLKHDWQEMLKSSTASTELVLS